jgi:hypothetical protein
MLSPLLHLFQVPTCCACHVQGYSFDFPPRATSESQETSPHREHFPGAGFTAQNHEMQQQNSSPNEGFKENFADDLNLRPPLLTNSEQFHDESFGQTLNHDQGARGPFNNKQTITEGHFQSDNQFHAQGHRNQFTFQEDSTRNQFQFHNDDTRNQFQDDNSRKHFQGQLDLRAPLQSPKRGAAHFSKAPELHVTPPPATFHISSQFHRQGFRHPTSEGLIPPGGPPLPLAHETDFHTFSGNQILRRSRNQTSDGLR